MRTRTSTSTSTSTSTRTSTSTHLSPSANNAATTGTSAVQATAQRPRARWLVVLAIVAAMGIGVDVLEGRHASASAQAASTAGQNLPFIDHSPATRILADVPMDVGASIAAYDMAPETSQADTAAPAQVAETADAQQAGASIAAYGD